MYDLGSLVEMDGDRIKKLFEVNFFAVCRVNRVFLPILSKGGKIIITSSELAPLDPLPFTGLYGVTKSTVEKYAFSLRMELNILGYRVVLLRPGAVKTGMIGVSTDRLSEFCESTSLYSCNAKRFRKIVDSVETKNISPEKIASKVLRILKAKHPKYVYNVNRNLLLRLLSALPDGMQTGIIKMILKK
jgi:short-subunit dehydrogenase